MNYQLLSLIFSSGQYHVADITEGRGEPEIRVDRYSDGTPSVLHLPVAPGEQLDVGDVVNPRNLCETFIFYATAERTRIANIWGGTTADIR